MYTHNRVQAAEVQEGGSGRHCKKFPREMQRQFKRAAIAARRRKFYQSAADRKRKFEERRSRDPVRRRSGASVHSK